MQVAAAIQNATQRYWDINGKKKRDTTQKSLYFFFFLKRADRIAGNQNVCHQRQVWVKLQLALLLLLLTILQLYHLPPLLPPPVSDSSCLFAWCQPLCAGYYTVLLDFSRYCTVRKKSFTFAFVHFYVLFVWKILQTYDCTVLIVSVGYLG